MLEKTGEPVPPADHPSRINPWLIIVLISGILCCFCIGAVGLLFAFGGPILNELGLTHALVTALVV